MNIGQLLTKSARSYPENLAMVHGSVKLNYFEFNARVNRLANGLSSLGICKGDNIALVLHNYPEMLEAMFACFKAGIGVVPINWRLHPKEFAFIIDHSEAKIVVCSHEFNQALLEIRDLIPKVQSVIC